MTETPAIRCCGTCRFFALTLQADPWVIGECRVHAPVFWDGNDSQWGRWPEVNVKMWCGEWQAKEAE